MSGDAPVRQTASSIYRREVEPVARDNRMQPFKIDRRRRGSFWGTKRACHRQQTLLIVGVVLLIFAASILLEIFLAR